MSNDHVDTGLTSNKISIWTWTHCNERQVASRVKIGGFSTRILTGMSVQKKFVLGFFSFIFFIFIVGFITGYFSCPGAEYSNCCGAKNENDDTSRKLLEQEAFELISGRKIAYYLKWVPFYITIIRRGMNLCTTLFTFKQFKHEHQSW